MLTFKLIKTLVNIPSRLWFLIRHPKAAIIIADNRDEIAAYTISLSTGDYRLDATDHDIAKGVIAHIIETKEFSPRDMYWDNDLRGRFV